VRAGPHHPISHLDTGPVSHGWWPALTRTSRLWGHTCAYGHTTIGFCFFSSAACPPRGTSIWPSGRWLVHGAEPAGRREPSGARATRIGPLAGASVHEIRGSVELVLGPPPLARLFFTGWAPGSLSLRGCPLHTPVAGRGARRGHAGEDHATLRGDTNRQLAAPHTRFIKVERGVPADTTRALSLWLSPPLPRPLPVYLPDGATLPP